MEFNFDGTINPIIGSEYPDMFPYLVWQQDYTVGTSDSYDWKYQHALLEQISQTNQMIVACLLAAIIAFALDKLLPY